MVHRLVLMIIAVVAAMEITIHLAHLMKVEVAAVVHTLHLLVHHLLMMAAVVAVRLLRLQAVPDQVVHQALLQAIEGNFKK